MTRLQKHRKSACRAQRGLCFYCQCRMGSSVTAEHLKARKDGGTDRKENIAAACWSCNHDRHADPQMKALDVPMIYGIFRQLKRLSQFDA